MQQAIYEAFVSIGWWEILVTMCNTLITFAIIKKFLFKPVRKMLAQREEEVKTIYSAAEQAQTEAEQKRTEYTEASLEGEGGGGPRSSAPLPAARPCAARRSSRSPRSRLPL